MAKCAHPTCDCQARAGDKFCGDNCRDNQLSGCSCDHAECSHRMRKR